MNDDTKIILEKKDFTAIVEYLRSVPVAFDRVEAAHAAKAAIGRAMLADVKFDNKIDQVGFPNRAPASVPVTDTPYQEENGPGEEIETKDNKQS
jgi:hypothetical protein